jgi:Domain of unknown function (DUF4148)
MKLSSLNRLVVQGVSGSLIVSAALLAASTSVYAQARPEPGTHQVTRAEVLHELEELESVGYYPFPGDPYYPDDIQAAEERLRVKHEVENNSLRNANQAVPTRPMP